MPRGNRRSSRGLPSLVGKFRWDFRNTLRAWRLRPGMKWCFLTVLVGFSGVAMAAAKDEASVIFRSGPAQVPLLELFTSEGCSSCPPAERWLGDLRTKPGLWRDFVPVAWHVDYWDRLGWPDRFASRAYTERQYAYAASWDSDRVYTPCFVRAGEEWHPRQGPLIKENNGTPGDMEIEVRGTQVIVRYEPVHSKSASTRVHIALLGGGIESPVKRGENRGKRLRHEFLVLGTGSALLLSGEATLSLPVAAPDVKIERHGLAAWITEDGAIAPVQATGGWLP